MAESEGMCIPEVSCHPTIQSIVCRKLLMPLQRVKINTTTFTVISGVCYGFTVGAGAIIPIGTGIIGVPEKNKMHS